MKKNIKAILRSEENIIDCDINYRGGSLKIDASELFEDYCNKTGEKAIVGAYQNYLGGGMAGSIVGGAMFGPSDLNKKEKAIFDEVIEEAKLFFYDLNNGGGDEYMQENVTGKNARLGYLKNQSLPSNYPGL